MKPDWCSEEVWERALAVQDKAIERCKAGKLAYRFPTCNGKSVLDEEISRALLDAHQCGKDESQAEIDRLNQVIERMQKAMSSQAEQWSRTMAEARREGMGEAAAVCDEGIELAKEFGPHHIPIISGIRQTILDKARG